MPRTGPQSDARRVADATLDPVTVSVDGQQAHGAEGEWLVDLLDRTASRVPHVCYHPHLGPLQTCDTCWVRVDGELRRACATPVRDGMTVETQEATVADAREEGMHRILGQHNLYCTVCDRNNGDCDVHNATKAFGIEHQRYDFREKPYALDESHPFYRYDPDQCILCGRCVEACQNVQVTETLSIDWSLEVPRVVWDGGVPAGESSCVSCGHCVTVCPCNALMEKTMLGEAGHFTAMPKPAFQAAVELVKSVEPVTGTGPILALSDAEAAMREASIRRTKTVCTYCGVGCTFDVWTRDRHLLKVLPTGKGPANGISTCVKGKFGWDFVNSPDRLRRPLIRRRYGDQERFEDATSDEALDTVATRMRAIAEQYGPDSVAFIATSKATNEESFLVQKMARAVFGTNNVDN
ncbi:MAG TPA: 2Fe-2S iron-sulfur cluster-binding protein, partial [Rhodothermales bacterium]|nr:2Fe-2S iron-sulfur cluster-binding protein [Rhodothermales bacterium]